MLFGNLTAKERSRQGCLSVAGKSVPYVADDDTIGYKSLVVRKRAGVAGSRGGREVGHTA